MNLPVKLTITACLSYGSHSDNLTVNLSHEKYNADVDSKGSEVSYDEDVATGATPDSIVVTPTCRYSNVNRH